MASDLHVYAGIHSRLPLLMSLEGNGLCIQRGASGLVIDTVLTILEIFPRYSGTFYFTAIQRDGRRPGRTPFGPQAFLREWNLKMPSPVPAKSSSADSPAVSSSGRHRGQPVPILVVRGVALTSYRLALMGALALLAVVSAALRALT
jgi:hypothetical protein